MKRSTSLFALIALGATLVSACNDPVPQPDPSTASPPKKSSSSPGDSPAAGAKGPFAQSTNPAMTNPSLANEKAPDTFRAEFKTSGGTFVLACHRDWAPNGVDRFYNLVKIGFFQDVAFFRAVKGFMVQFGIHGNPAVASQWQSATLPVDVPTQSNTRGRLSFAMAQRPTTRSTQLFINYADNSRLDKMGFAPLCEVEGNGMDVLDKLYQGYAERPSQQQGRIQAEGNKFLRSEYPELDYIESARVLDDVPAPATSASADASGAPSSDAAPSASAMASSAPSASASAAPSAAPSASPKASGAPKASAAPKVTTAPPK